MFSIESDTQVELVETNNSAISVSGLTNRFALLARSEQAVPGLWQPAAQGSGDVRHG
ncbi:hypothetical protein [Pseudomonas sp. NFACC44-2]|uniref:hypothetical protein n=1 Tax=unclassified Pseudomonas TaxID=196821 RepID=UPI00147CDD6C